MPDHYAETLNRCLAREDKAHRDAVLAEYPPATQAIIRRLMDGIAKRLANYIIHAGARDHDLSSGERRALRKARLDAIREPWLRRRVDSMARELYAEYRKAKYEQLREAAG